MGSTLLLLQPTNFIKSGMDRVGKRNRVCQQRFHLASAFLFFKETKSAIMNIFRKMFFSKNGVKLNGIKLCFNNKFVHYS